MKTLGVCVAIIGGALITANGDILGGSVLLVIAAGCFWWNAGEKCDASGNLEESNHDDER